MTMIQDGALVALVGGVLALLIVASIVGAVLSARVTSASGRATVDNINARIRAWWVMTAVFVLAVVVGRGVSVLLFALMSFLALREFVTLAPTRPGDHRALFWSFFIVTPLQYYLVWTEWYGLFSILIPVYVSIFLAIRTALAGDTEHFLERTAINQWGLMICVYFVSHVPALLMLPIPGDGNVNARLMFYFVLVVQLSDVLQFVWGKSIGRRPVAPSISPNKTWEGLIGGAGSATLIGAALWWATPFRPIEAGVMALLLTIMGFAGGLIMSAIKRDRGVKDYGSMLSGHGGILDRIDSLCFAAPVFFHLTRYFFAR
ncbi:MAG: phosphatidate cytidylyltransferase [Acidobacteria bacterium]|nr:phosphatidate cytidylyltransferase [Acidobacteriota bacterium]